MNQKYNFNRKVKCGHSDCVKKDICPHYEEHNITIGCLQGCVISGNIHKCYTIIELRKIKIEKLSNNE